MELWNKSSEGGHATPSAPRFVASGLRDESGECGYRVGWAINPHMKIGAACPRLAEREHREFLDELRTRGADVDELPFVSGAYDSVFMKDNALVIEDVWGSRALPARPYSPEREAEPVARIKDLRALGWDVHPQPSYSFEGGDVIVCAQKKFALMGYGFRTSIGLIHELREFLQMPVLPLALRNPYFYHLDTALNVVVADGRGVAFALREAFTAESWRNLCGHPDLERVIEVERDEAMQFGLNWVEVKNTVVIGSRVPRIERALRDLGKDVCVRPLSQFRLAGGSAACLVAPVHQLH